MPGNDIMLAWRKDRQHARNVVRDMLPVHPAGAPEAPGTRPRVGDFQGVRVSLTSSEAVRDEIDKRSELRRGAAIRQIDDMRGLRGQRIIAQDGRKEPGLDVIGQ